MLVDDERQIYNLSKIKEGSAVWAKHQTWNKGKIGLIAIAREENLIIQYQPDIRNVTNHYQIPVQQAASGEWEIRISEDLRNIITL